MGDAIQKDVSEEVSTTDTEEKIEEKQQEEVSSPVDPRMEEMERIAASVIEKRNEEAGIKPEEEAEETEEDDKKESDEDTEKSTDDSEEEAEEETKESDTEDPMVEIKVDGEVQQVPLSKIKDAGIRSLQKETSADKRLEEATRAREEAQKLLDETKSTLPGQDAEITDEKADATGLAEKRKSLSEAIQYGTEDEVLSAFEQYEDALGESVAPKLDPNELNSRVYEAIETRKLQEKFASSPEKGGFSDLIENQYVFQAVQDRVEQKIKAGEDGSKWETYQTAGEEIREEIAKIAKAKLTDNSEKGREQKIKKKKSLDVVKPASGKVPQKPKKKPPTRSEIISEMAKLRGQGG